jgi:hypothetical protein
VEPLLSYQTYTGIRPVDNHGSQEIKSNVLIYNPGYQKIKTLVPINIIAVLEGFEITGTCSWSNGLNTRIGRLLKIEEPPRPPPANTGRDGRVGRSKEESSADPTRPHPTRPLSSSFRGARDCAQKLVRAQEELACVGTGPNSPHISFHSTLSSFRLCITLVIV